MHSDIRKCTYRELLSLSLNPLTVPELALEAIGVLEERLTEEKWLIVNRLRKSGSSWSDIGHEFGITRQAAQQRFGKWGEQTLFDTDAQQ